MDRDPHCCFDDWAASNAARVRRGGSAPLVQAMLEQLDAAGLADRTLLDVGCGSGELSLGALDRGAARVRGIDLGSGAIELARGLARDRGVEARAVFEVADGSVAELGAVDVVAMSRVVCCYADPTALLDNTLGAARAVVAFSAPVDRGVMGVVNRALVTMSNAWYAVRPRKYRGFRTFVHDLSAIDARVRSAGFTERHRSRRRLAWELAVYSR